MSTREIRRYLNRYGRLTEPLFVFVLIGAFIIPILGVTNMSPRTLKPSIPARQEVLGVTQEAEGLFLVEKVGGVHGYIGSEQLKKIKDNRYIYNATIDVHQTGKYSKPILMITNGTDQTRDVTFTISPVDSGSDIGVSYDDTNYLLSTADGELYPHTMETHNGEYYLYLNIRSDSPVNFAQQITINIVLSD